MPTMAVEAQWSSHASPTGLSFTTTALSMHTDGPMPPFTVAGTLGSPSRHLDPTTALAEAWRRFCLL